MTSELKALVGTLSSEARDAATEALLVAGSNALRGTGMLTREDDLMIEEVQGPRELFVVLVFLLLQV